MTPQRIKRERTKGWKMPPNTIYVGRPSHWGNIYQVGKYEFDCHGEGVVPKTVQECVDLYEAELKSDMQHDRGVKNGLINELRGHNLACWCKLDAPCHADVLLRLANE